MISRNGGNNQDAEDIFQESLIIVCRKLKDPGFELTSRLSTYLFSICRFLWKDACKKRKKHLPIDFDTGFNSLEQIQEQHFIDQEERARQAEEIINGLGDRCRELLILFYNMGMKLKDIALKMGYNTEATAKNQKYKCLETARQKLKDLQQKLQTSNP
jgi:RNA polymerase sigma factor (sigma-70 family)